ncbi:MAG: hypothetical protein QG646_3066 [Euryarchaeota archaeon]|nr:hypothetical protein [Euryarchaeota archaeon]
MILNNISVHFFIYKKPVEDSGKSREDKGTQ